MTDNFKLYSQYYDLLYQDKDYIAETNYLVDLINQYRPNSKSIIELGSGTGKHANLLAEKGFEVLGLERSVEMVKIANKTKNDRVNFKVADITKFETETNFDVALSLFHVISYLNQNNDLINTFKNVHRCLNTGGLFIFDVWHSPAVDYQKPEHRTKTLQNQNIKVVREANPITVDDKNVVEVNYNIEVTDLTDHSIVSFQEKHPMRHFSKPDIELLAYGTGFEILHTEEFLTKAVPSNQTWGVCYILRKIRGLEVKG